MTRPTESPAWAALQAHRARMGATTLKALFDADPSRATRWRFAPEGLDGFSLDMARTHVTEETLRLLLDLARAQDLEGWREKLFTGAKINASEGRAVLHTALRAATPEPIRVDGEDVMPAVAALRRRLATFTEDVRRGRWTGATGKPIRHVVNIGIGGSDLGPRLVAQALGAFASGPAVHFVANVDAADLLGTLVRLDPAETLFVIVSKTFTTQETLLNARTARQWLTDALGTEAVDRHFVAVSANHEAVAAFGIAPESVFPLWDWVGGRFSLWSSVGLSAALALGWDMFARLLKGAAAMDRHFRTAPLERNLPVLMGLIGVWYRNFRDARAQAILPYAERLRELPRFLQQLEMESNGKAVTRDGLPVNVATAPVIFGERGSIGQHSFHQWLHQGTEAILSDFIGIREDSANAPEHHRVLRAHFEGQIKALAFGRKEADPARANPGDRPSMVIMLDRLDPERLGMLLALYEHKVFVQGVVWDINSFDQWGVELGKKLAAAALTEA